MDACEFNGRNFKETSWNRKLHNLKKKLNIYNWTQKTVISWYIHHLWTDFKVIRYLNNLVDGCGFGGRNLEEAFRKCPTIENCILKMSIKLII